MQVFCQGEESFEAKYSFYETPYPRPALQFGLCQAGVLTLTWKQRKNGASQPSLAMWR